MCLADVFVSPVDVGSACNGQVPQKRAIIPSNEATGPQEGIGERPRLTFFHSSICVVEKAQRYRAAASFSAMFFKRHWLSS